MKFEKEQINLTITPSVEYALAGITNRLYVLFDYGVTKIQSEETEERKPIELSIVLDRSGSMGGQKIEESKLAIKKVIENLKTTDILHLVQYDDEIDVVFKNGDLKKKDPLIQKVSQIQARSSTNLSGGVIEGAKLINTKKNKEHLKRVFLFSDGLANVGITNPKKIYDIIKKIHREGINVSSFGIGADFDEELMKMIAEHGAGDYFFIDGPDTIPDIVNEGLEGLLEIVTTNNMLSVKATKGCTIEKIYTFEGLEAKLGDFREDEHRQVLLELTVDPSKLNDTHEILKYTHTYSNMDDPLKTQSVSGAFSIKITDNEDKIIEENADVIVYRTLLEVSEEEEKIANLLENYEYDKAIEGQNEIIGRLKAIQGLDKKNKVSDKLDWIEQTLDMMKSSKENQDRFETQSTMKQLRYSSYQSVRSKKRKFQSK